MKGMEMASRRPHKPPPLRVPRRGWERVSLPPSPRKRPPPPPRDRFWGEGRSNDTPPLSTSARFRMDVSKGSMEGLGAVEERREGEDIRRYFKGGESGEERKGGEDIRRCFKGGAGRSEIQGGVGCGGCQDSTKIYSQRLDSVLTTRLVCQLLESISCFLFFSQVE